MDLFKLKMFQWLIVAYTAAVAVFPCLCLQDLGRDSAEIQCYSRFDYEYKVLQKLVHLEESQKALRETIEKQQEEISRQAKEIQRLATREEEAKSLINTHGQKIGTLEEKQTSVSAEQVTVTKKLDNITSRLERVSHASGSTVAFSAYLDETKTFNRAAVPFNHVLLNEPADVYNQTSGIFTCPITGVYMFYFVVATRGVGGTSEVFAELKVQNSVIVQAVSDSRSDTHDVQGSNMAIVKLKTGDGVYVSAERKITGNTWGRSNTRTSSFAGFLLRATE